MNIIPNLVFIIPYRDREHEKGLFIEKMTSLLKNNSSYVYKFLFIHQDDSREFNRGAMKNVGFLVIKDMYPLHYHDITLCFNDIDTYPKDDTVITNYLTSRGIVKHFYGFRFALHSIFCITGHDFELVNGFPNFWSWGYEDNMMYERVIAKNIYVDRSVFFPIGDSTIIQHNNSHTRIVNEIEFQRFIRKTTEGIYSITNLRYYMTEDVMVHVTSFTTEFVCRSELNKPYDVRSREAPFMVGYSARRRCSMNLVKL
jgi:hypothetical protein